MLTRRARLRSVWSRSAVASVVSVVFLAIAESIADGVPGGLITGSVVVLILALTALGVGSIRALPIVLLTVLVFFTTYVWVMSATISQTRMWLAICLLVAIATASLYLHLGDDRAQPRVVGRMDPQWLAWTHNGSSDGELFGMGMPLYARNRYGSQPSVAEES